MADPRYEDWEGWVPGLCRRMVELPQTNVIIWGIIYCWVYHIMVVYIEEVSCFFSCASALASSLRVCGVTPIPGKRLIYPDIMCVFSVDDLLSLFGCFRHAADTAPLEGLPILRCAIYDPLERLQISKMRLAEMGV